MQSAAGGSGPSFTRHGGSVKIADGPACTAQRKIVDLYRRVRAVTLVRSTQRTIHPDVELCDERSSAISREEKSGRWKKT
jgi:hypothetical protein